MYIYEIVLEWIEDPLSFNYQILESSSAFFNEDYLMQVLGTFYQGL